MGTFLMRRGDISPAFRFLLPDTVDLTGATVVFNLRDVLTRAPAEVVRLAPPAVQYNWQAGDTDWIGIKPAEFEVTFPGGGVETFWRDERGRLAVHVTDSLDHPSVAIVHVVGDTVAEPFTLRDDAGVAVDLTGAAVSAVIVGGGATWTQALTIRDPLLGEAWPDWGALALPPGRYTIRLRVTWPDGGIETASEQFDLQVVA